MLTQTSRLAAAIMIPVRNRAKQINRRRSVRAIGSIVTLPFRSLCTA
jgi:hypothetical protein